MDYEDLSEEEHEAAMEAMLNGSFDKLNDEEVKEEEVTETNEDTDQQEEPEEEEESTEPIDDEDSEESETEEEDEEEYTPVDEDSSEEESEEEDEEESEEETVDEAEETEEEEQSDEEETNEDSAETEAVEDVAKAETTDTIDYKKFYEEVTAEFTANGTKRRGFTDPKKIIQSQQMAAGFSEKMAGFKKYKPYMAPLKDMGMLDNPEKFNLAMNIMSGDKEAIKKHIADLKLDPITDLDLDEIDYKNTNVLTSEVSMVMDDTMEVASRLGVDAKLQEVLSKDWDDSSFGEFIDNSKVRDDLIHHLKDGSYELVNQRIAEMASTDVMGTFNSMSSIEKYRAAATELEAEYRRDQALQENTKAKQAEQSAQTAEAESRKKIEEEKAKIAKARKAKEYKQKVETEQKKVAAKRKKASLVSKKKVKSKPAAKFDPMKLEGDDFDMYMQQLINGG